nr:hypothetical protein [Mycoplasmopsis bovis]
MVHQRRASTPAKPPFSPEDKMLKKLIKGESADEKIEGNEQQN